MSGVDVTVAIGYEVRMRLRERAMLEGLDLVDLDAEAAQAAGAAFVDCTVTRGVWDGADLGGTGWRGTTLHQVRWVGVRAPRTVMADVTISGCAFSACELFGARWDRVRLHGVLLDSVNLRTAHWRDVELVDCVLRDVDLGGARLERVRIPGCRVERLDLTGAGLRDVDLGGARLHLARGVEALRGATIDGLQLVELAPVLAAEFGILVRPVDG